MATRLYSTGPGQKMEDIVEAVGSATTTSSIELTVDLSTSIKYAADGTTVAVSKEDVLKALENLEQYIIRSKWPPA